MRDILLYGYWHGTYQRPHHLVRWLEKQGISTRVLTQCPIFQLPSAEFQHPNLCSCLRYVRTFPIPTCFMAPVRSALIAVQETEAYRNLGNNIPVIVYNVTRVLPRKAKPLVFDCLDDFAGFGSKRNKEYERLQNKLAKKADVIWTTSHKLYNLWYKRYPEKTHLIPNGVDVEHFSSAVEFTPPAERPLLRGKEAIVGYVGVIAHWFDYHLLRRVVESLSEVQFVLVGPVYPGCEWPWPDNVTLIGIQPYNKLPQILRQWDCCIIPFVVNDLTNATNPVKMYEYLAAGKPVVSTRLPEVQEYERAGIVETAGNPTDFAAAIMKSIESCWDKRLIDERLAVAKENSWEIRWEAAYKTLEPFLPADWH